MTGTSPTQTSPPKSRAAFSREDVEDAKRGHPDFELKEFARRTGQPTVSPANRCADSFDR